MRVAKTFSDAVSPLRNLYHPVQPTITEKDNDVVYQEFLPAQQLQPFVYCYWELRTIKKLEVPFQYRVVADGCIDIYFDLHNPIESYVMGFCKNYTEFPLEHQFHYVGIRFLPTMFPQLFKVDASILSNRYQYLRDVIPAPAQFIQENINSKLTSTKMVSTIDSLLLKVLAASDFNNDPRLYGAIQNILSRFGVVNIETDLDTGISARQLRRLFEYYVGDSAKTFAKVVRFQNILRAKPSTQSLQHNKLFYDAGYYDQAHFIKEFKNFYGVTPSKAFGR
ncbi:AraC family transcriptional regulator [Pseudochryseolinea flava]|uniref:AraC family transcriptional regulator n=2 Tax=Pseudochryseolinea flava TaxID=2059302 RepID=A0A364Y2E7_9BACT|nr:AraC family transcriptional regulator [Pseudochryseolinea flava]